MTAVETHYYWPDLKADLKEVCRVLKPAGRVALVVECYRGKRFGLLDGLALRLLGGRIFSVGEPTSRRRPSDDELDILVAIAEHAADAIEALQPPASLHLAASH